VCHRFPTGEQRIAAGKPELRTKSLRGPCSIPTDISYGIQVKQKDRVGRPDIDGFEAVMTREDRTKGFFVGFDYSDDALREIDAFFRKCGKVIVALTMREILDEQLAKKLA
jgi:hypothetical protein